MFSIRPLYDPLVLNLNLFFFHRMKPVLLWGESLPSPPAGSFSLPFSPQLAFRTATYLTPCLSGFFVGLEHRDQWGFPQGGGWLVRPCPAHPQPWNGRAQPGRGSPWLCCCRGVPEPSGETSRSRGCSHGPYGRAGINCSTLQTKNLATPLPVSLSLESSHLWRHWNELFSRLSSEPHSFWVF